VPIHVITVPELRLDHGRDQARLRDAVRRLAPRLRLHRIDENDAGEVSALLGYLRTLQRRTTSPSSSCNHACKNGGAGAQAGQSLRGGGDLHAWGDSNLYVRRQKDALVLTIEHRAAAAPDPLRLQLVAGDDADVHLAIIASVTFPSGTPRDLDSLVLEALGRAGRALSRSQPRAELRVRNERLGDALAATLHDPSARRAAAQSASRYTRPDGPGRNIPSGTFRLFCRAGAAFELDLAVRGVDRELRDTFLRGCGRRDFEALWMRRSHPAPAKVTYSSKKPQSGSCMAHKTRPRRPQPSTR
jgi:hypothetical protein